MSTGAGRRIDGLRDVIRECADIAAIELRADDERGGLLPDTRKSFELIRHRCHNALENSRASAEMDIQGQLELPLHTYAEPPPPG